jgi:hypothetical protein
MLAGILKAVVGLSASMYTYVYAAAFRPDALSFLLVIAVAPVALGLCAMPFFNAVPAAAASPAAACPEERAGVLPMRPVDMSVTAVPRGFHEV